MWCERRVQLDSLPETWPVALVPLINPSSSRWAGHSPPWDLLLELLRAPCCVSPMQSLSMSDEKRSLFLAVSSTNLTPWTWGLFFPPNFQNNFKNHPTKQTVTQSRISPLPSLSLFSLEVPRLCYLFALGTCCWNRALLSFVHFPFSHSGYQISFLNLAVYLLNYLGFSDYAITSEIKGHFNLFFSNFYTDVFIFLYHCLFYNANSGE